MYTFSPFGTLACFLVVFGYPCGIVAWVPLGSMIKTPDSGISDSDLPIDVSDDGRRVAVGEPGYGSGKGAVLIYELGGSVPSVPPYHHSHDAMEWKLLATIEGESNEGIGDILSLSPDGRLVAVRRRSPTFSSNQVQVYDVEKNDSDKGSIVGSTVSCSLPSNVTGIALSQVLALQPSSISNERLYHLLLACEDDDEQRGMVQSFVLENNMDDGDLATTSAKISPSNMEWNPHLPMLRGESPGDRFGAAISMSNVPAAVDNLGYKLMIAVASPGYSASRGRVQVFTADERSDKKKWAQLGSDILGSQVGGMLGSSIKMSATTDPYVAVGSPNKRVDGFFNSHGILQLYHWRSSAPGQPSSWNQVGLPESGLTDFDAFGYAVAISRDGSRVAASSKRYDNNRGYIRVYERNAYDSLNPVGDPQYGLRAGDMLGASIALNGAGSVVFSGSICTTSMGNCSNTSQFGIVNAWIDNSSFCRYPSSLAGPDVSTTDAYLNRSTCRNGFKTINDSDNCMGVSVFSDGKMMTCKWESRPFLPTLNPTPSPAIPPSDLFSHQPTTASIASISPTDLFSHQPTTASIPSQADDFGPTHAPVSTDILLTKSPSSMPTFIYLTYPPSELVSSLSPTNGQFQRDEGINTPDTSQAPLGPLTSIPTDISVGDDNHASQNLQIIACQCNKNNICSSRSISKGSSLRICIQAIQPGLEFLTIDRMVLKKESFLMSVIEGGQVTTAGATQMCSGILCISTSTVPNTIFEGIVADGSAIEIVGVVAVDSGTPTRRLRSQSSKSSSDHRELDFNIFISLDNSLPNESDAGIATKLTGADSNDLPMLTWIIVSLIGAAAIGFCSLWLWRRFMS